MKKINKIIVWFLVILGVVFVCFSVFVALFGKKIVVSQIEQNLKLKTSLESISLGLPFSVKLTNLEIGGLLRAERISFYPNILGLFAGKIVLSGLTVINPVINLERSSDGSFNLPEFEQKASPPPVLLTGLVIKKGRIVFTDKKINPQGYQIIADNIDIEISKVMLPPTSLNTKFKLTASFMDSKAAALGNARFSGWVDFGPKNMDADLEIDGLDVTYFVPYCGNFISDKKLLSARLNLKSQMKAENNDLAVLSNLRLSDLAYAKDQDQTEKGVSKFELAMNTLDLFTDTEGNLNLEFTINTKLDKPGINIADLKGIMLAAAVKNLSSQPPAQVIDKVNNAIEQIKGFGKDMKQLKDLFKKKE
ncbi:MAG: DUF748 domain-containing protein [Candidatus Omnitrophota bacterium]